MLRTRCVYNMSQNKLIAIQKYIVETLKKNRFSNNSTRFLMLFVKKSNNILRFCVNYRKLNEITIKNKYFLLLLLKTLERFAHAKRFIKINICNAYYRIQIRKSDK